MTSLSIGQLANKAQVNIETIRYYERRGLLAEPPRRASGYRQYSQKDVALLQFIKRAQVLGFSLKEISELLNLRVNPEMTCADVKKRAQDKIADIEGKVRTLEHMKAALRKLVASCRGRGPTRDCPILEAMDTTEEGNANR